MLQKLSWPVLTIALVLSGSGLIWHEKNWRTRVDQELATLRAQMVEIRLDIVRMHLWSAERAGDSTSVTRLKTVEEYLRNGGLRNGGLP